MRKRTILLGSLVLALGRFAAGQPEISLSGLVLETTNASRYTYVRIDSGKGTVWAAGPAFHVKTGDRVVIEGGMPVKNFKSKVLNRTFDDLYLAGSIAVIQNPAGEKTVAEIWSGKAEMSGKTVIVRARVVKVVPGIMGLNWLHLRDGAGAAGGRDLVATTKDEVHVGDVVTLSGTIGTDRDFGSGYNYEIIMEKATVLGKLDAGLQRTRSLMHQPGGHGDGDQDEQYQSRSKE